jgi:transcriptional regulator with XRE-family HTH domain
MLDSEFSPNEIDDLYKQIGRNVKKFRLNKKMTQLELSLNMGYASVSLVSAAELYTRKKHFNIEHLYKISKILNVNICDFFHEQ